MAAFVGLGAQMNTLVDAAPDDASRREIKERTEQFMSIVKSLTMKDFDEGLTSLPPYPSEDISNSSVNRNHSSIAAGRDPAAWFAELLT